MRDGTYLNRELQDHGDDAFPTAGEVEPFREPDSEAPEKQQWDGMTKEFPEAPAHLSSLIFHPCWTHT